MFIENHTGQKKDKTEVQLAVNGMRLEKKKRKQKRLTIVIY